MTIIPGEGLDSLGFGSSKKNVLSILGPPSSIVYLRDDGEEWLYNDIETTLFFDFKDSDRLSSIETDNESATLFGIHLIHSNKEYVIDELNNLGFTEYEDHCWEERLYFPQINMSFLFEYDEVVSILWS